MPIPFFEISTRSGIVVTDRTAGGNIELTVTDGVGASTDTVQFRIDDKEGIIAPPRTGEGLSIVGGYRDGARRNFGSFVVDEVTLDGYPQTIDVQCQSLAAKGMGKLRETKSYKPPEYQTYGDVFREIAGKIGLTPAITSALADVPLRYEMQSEERPAAFLTRIFGKLGGAVSVKDQHLIATEKGKGTSATGIVRPPIYVASGKNLISYSVSVRDKPRHGTVEATFFDREAAERKSVKIETGDDGPTFLIRSPFPGEDEAKRAAQAKVGDLRRATGSANFLIDGDPDARAEAELYAYGIRSLVDGVWRATNVVHSWSGSSAYTTTISCELPTSAQGANGPSAGGTERVPIPTPRPAA